MIDPKEYPSNWKALSLQVRTEANWKCERCKVKNQAVIIRCHGNGWMEVGEIRADRTADWEDTSKMTWKRLRFHGLTKIVLTVAHLDRDRNNNERSNLAALCQRCHLNHDRAAQHVPARKFGRRYDRDHQTKIQFTPL